jgi:serine/threonine protein kinase
METQYSRPLLSNRILLTPEMVFEKVPFKFAKKIFPQVRYVGYGGFADVIEAKWNEKGDSMHGKFVAIKMQSGPQRCCLEEVSALWFCKHPNVVELYKVLKVRTEYWMVMEYLQGGSLAHVVKFKEERFEESEISYVAKRILNGIAYLHSLQIAHRDVKNQNILLSFEGDVKLIDFGLAADMSDGPRYGFVGSPFWMAPEMIRGEPYTFGVDIWSFMVCICDIANQCKQNDNPRTAMFLTATRGFEQPLLNPSKWSDTFKVRKILFILL